MLSNKIIGGEPIKNGEKSYAVLSKIRNSKVACGGSLVSREFVMTAAHCVHDIKPPNYTGLTVLIGSIHCSMCVKLYKVVHKEIPNEYNHKIFNSCADIALLTVSRS